MVCNNANCVIAPDILYITKDDVSSYKTSLVTLSFSPNSQLNRIEESSFSYFNSLKKVDFSNCNELAIIHDLAFYSCTSLKEVIFPENGILETLDGGCFSHCPIESIKLPKSLKEMYMTSNPSNTGAFSGCSRLKKIEFYSENNLKHIGEYSFRITSLEEFEIGPNLESITGIAFEGVTQSFKRFVMRSTNQKYHVYNDMLYEVNKLVFCPPSIGNIELLSSTTSIGGEAFGCNIMSDCAFLPQSVSNIANWAFMGCTYLKRVILPNSITSIGSYCFHNCYNLESFIFSGNIQTISRYLFDGCTSLKSVIIQNGVETIDDYSFKSFKYLWSDLGTW